MSRWTYYSPIAVGVLLILSVHGSVQAQVAWLPDWLEWPAVIGIALLAGLVCQLGLVGAQGAFGQVLPAPGGRSVRGSGAVLTGALLLLALGLGIAAGLLALEGAVAVALWLGIGSAAVAIGSAAAYSWSFPAAVKDFSGDD